MECRYGAKSKEEDKWSQQGDFKNGITVEIDGNIYQILEFQHVKTGKGSSVCKNKAEKYYQRRCS